MEVIRWSGRQARVKLNKQLKLSSNTEAERPELDNTLIQTGKWVEVSQFNTKALVQAIRNNPWKKELIDKITHNGRIEEASSIHISKLKDEDKYTHGLWCSYLLSHKLYI